LPAVFVGDSEVDAETAQAAGVSFALFTGGYRKSAIDTLPHAAAFDHHAELPGLVARLLPVPA
jgi:phosphoglycolate phosphatase